MSTHNEKDGKAIIIDGVLHGGLREIVRQMDDMNRALLRNSKGKSQLQLPLPTNLKFQTVKHEKEKGILYGDVRDAVRQMDELSRLINKNSKK